MAGGRDTPAGRIQNRDRWLALVLGALAGSVVLALYWPATRNGFVNDDWVVVVELAKKIPTTSWWEALLRPPAEYAVLFRPLAMLTFLLQLWAGQTAPGPFHLVNIVIHSTNVCLLTILAWHLLESETADTRRRLALAGLCGLLYGAHPALIEPVAWISARPDLVMTSMLCLALLGDRLLPQPEWSRALVVGAFFLAAMLCKETAVGLMAALPIVHLASARSLQVPAYRALRGAWVPHTRVYLAVLVAFALYLVARLGVTGPGLGMEDVNSPALYMESIGQHLLVVIATVSHHISAAIWPFQTIVPSRQLPLPIDAVQLMPIAAASGACVALALVAASRAGAAKAPALLFLAFLVALMPVANIVPIPAVSTPVEVAVASRYLTFPLVFACLAASLALGRLETLRVGREVYRRALLWTVTALWLVASAALVRITVPLWKDDAAIYAWVIRLGTPSFWHYGNVGASFLASGDLVRARDAFESAVKIRDDQHTAWIWHSLGAAEAGLGRSEAAARALKRALELAPGNSRARLLLSVIYRERGEPLLAAAVLEEGLTRIRASGGHDDQHGLLRYELGLAYAAAGRSREAIQHLTIAIELARDENERHAFRATLKSLAAQR